MPIGDKYVDLTRYLKECGKDRISLTVDKIGEIIDLPNWVSEWLSLGKNPWVKSK